MDKNIILNYSKVLSQLSLQKKINIMEVCGTHTTEFFRSGVKDIFPANLNLIDGPGCPVCVTNNEFLDRAIEITRKYGVILTTFGDMMRVPSSFSSLIAEKGNGLDIRVVYSPLDAIRIARENQGKEVVFLSVGFETTVPTEAIAVKTAENEGIDNFSILGGNKLTPPAVEALLAQGEVNIDGFILPGHVCTITGIKPWEFIAQKFNKPCVIAGFNTKDLLLATLMLVDLIKEGKFVVKNEYVEVVKYEGNVKAQAVIEEIFEKADSDWRGIGIIPASGLKLRQEFLAYDAQLKFKVELPLAVESTECKCGEVLRGIIHPPQCPLFGNKCTPRNPVGACMVSTEGSCAAYYKYRE